MDSQDGDATAVARSCVTEGKNSPAPHAPQRPAPGRLLPAPPTSRAPTRPQPQRADQNWVSRPRGWLGTPELTGDAENRPSARETTATPPREGLDSVSARAGCRGFGKTNEKLISFCWVFRKRQSTSLIRISRRFADKSFSCSLSFFLWDVI